MLSGRRFGENASSTTACRWAACCRTPGTLAATAAQAAATTRPNGDQTSQTGADTSDDSPLD